MASKLIICFNACMRMVGLGALNAYAFLLASTQDGAVLVYRFYATSMSCTVVRGDSNVAFATRT